MRRVPAATATEATVHTPGSRRHATPRHRHVYDSPALKFTHDPNTGQQHSSGVRAMLLPQSPTSRLRIAPHAAPAISAISAISASQLHSRLHLPHTARLASSSSAPSTRFRRSCSPFRAALPAGSRSRTQSRRRRCTGHNRRRSDPRHSIEDATDCRADTSAASASSACTGRDRRARRSTARRPCARRSSR